jgi:16S rRNA (adenine1518-N6/adenine1519-N6)-dimethyltransferase
MIKILEDRFKLYDNLKIKNEDVLKVNLKKLIKDEKKNNDVKNVKIVANLPYYITTPIIMKLLEEKLDLESITVMIQKEVAERLIAIPGDKETGAITYTVYYYSIGEKVMEVSNNSFIPEPQVTSEVIKLNIRNNPPIQVINKDLMFKIIKNAFMQRRKTLLNSLYNSKIFKNKEEGIKILEELGLDQNVRPEKLTLQDFANISGKVLNNIEN